MDSCNHIYRLFRDLYRYSGQTGPRHAGGQYRHSTLIPFLPSPRFPKTPIFSLLLRALRLQAHMASTAADLADIPSLDLMTEILRRMKCAQKPDRRLILVGVCSHSPSLSFLNGSAGCVVFVLGCFAYDVELMHACLDLIESSILSCVWCLNCASSSSSFVFVSVRLHFFSWWVELVKKKKKVAAFNLLLRLIFSGDVFHKFKSYWLSNDRIFFILFFEI